ncbi:MAG: hypothetical protein ABW252_15395 [Polyangiales bacterium]
MSTARLVRQLARPAIATALLLASTTHASLASAQDVPVPPPSDPSGAAALPDPAAPGPYEIVSDEGVGVGFESPINASDRPGNNALCEGFVQLFGTPAEQAREFAQIPAGMNMALYTLVRPKELREGQKYPILTWGNGTCALPRGYIGLLQHLASHGFVVIAANSRFTGAGTPLLRGLDWLAKQNADPSSPLYQKLDLDRIGALGHSQGAGATSIAGRDPRVKATALLNGGGSGGLRGPTFVLTGEQDISPAGARGAYNAATVPAAFLNLKKSDHITLITEPARTNPAITAWFRYQLLGDEAGKAYFAGTACKLCGSADWTYLQKNLK